MKAKLMMIALILSLGFNLGVLFTFGRHWLMKRECGNRPPEASWHKGKFRAMFNLTEDQQKRMEKDRREFQKTLAPVREELDRKREALFVLLDADTVDDSRKESLINDISLLQMKMEKAVIEHAIAVRKNLSPEQRTAMRTFMKKGLKRIRQEGPWSRFAPPEPFEAGRP